MICVQHKSNQRSLIMAEKIECGNKTSGKAANNYHNLRIFWRIPCSEKKSSGTLFAKKGKK